MVIEVFGINSQAILKMSMTILILVGIIYVYLLSRFGISYYIGKVLDIPFDRIISLVYSSTVQMSMSTAIAINTFGTIAGVGCVLMGPFSEMILMIVLAKVLKNMKNKIIIKK